MTTLIRLSLKEFLALPESEPASEYIDGEVIQKAMPTGVHAIIQLFLGHLFIVYLERHPRGEVGSEWRCVFGPPGAERAFVPDVAFVSNERLPTDRTALYQIFHGVPDLIIEVLSPGQHAGDFAAKVQFYLRHGVRLVWAIDPLFRRVQVFAPGEDTHSLLPDDVLDAGDVLPGFAVSLAQLFARIPPQP